MSMPPSPSQTAPLVSIILVTWNSVRWLPACLEALREQTLPNWELITVDNGSTDDSIEVVRQRMAQSVRLRNSTNTGFAAATNQALTVARGDYVLFLNADAVLSPSYVELLAAELAAHPKAGGATGKILRLADGGDPQRIDSTGLFVGRAFFARDRGANEIDRGQYDAPGEVFGVCCAAALLRRSMLDDVVPRGNVFDPRYVAFYEDLDLCWQARRRGWRFRYAPAALAWHARGGSLGAKRFFQRPPSFQRHVMRNRYRTVLRNATPYEVVRQLPALAAAELLLFGYAVVRAPHLLAVYVQVCKELPRYLRARGFSGAQRSPACSETRLRVLQLAQPHGGGVQKFVLQLCAHLDRKHFALYGMCGRTNEAEAPAPDRAGGESFAAGFERRGAPCETLPMRRAISPWSDLRALVGLLRFLRREPIDVIHAHSSKAGVLGRLAGMLSGVAVCYSPHAFAFLMPGARGWWYRALERIAARWGGAIVVESDAEHRQALGARLRSPAGLRRIANAIAPVEPPQRGRAELARDLGLDETAPWITMVGRLVEQKNPGCIVEAAPWVLRDHPSSQFLIIGDGPLHSALVEQIIRKRLDDRVRLLGYREDALDIVAASNLFVLPSLWEGLPFILLEAMARETPVIATDCVADDELLGDGKHGRVVPRGDAQALADAVVGALDDPTGAREMALRAARHVQAHHALDAMVRQFEELYRDLAGLPSPGQEPR